jgi:hypothetical protein
VVHDSRGELRDAGFLTQPEFDELKALLPARGSRGSTV